jgi:O-antigen/teichoic acid export membrane protein
VTAFIAGFNSTALFTQQRQVALGRVTLLNLGTQAIASVVIIAWAVLSPSVWASVASGIASTLFLAVLGHFAWGTKGHRDGFAWDPASARELVRFGRWIFLSTVLAFLSSQGDKLIFAPLIPRNLLGVYNNAATLAGAPTAAMLMLANSVLFPALSSKAREQGSLAGVFDRARVPVLWLSATMTAGLIASGPSFVHLLYAKAFVGADWMVRLLAVIGFLQILECTVGAALLALGHSRQIAVYCAIKLIGMVVLIPIGYKFFGFEGAMYGLIGAEALKYAGAAVSGLRVGLDVFVRDFWAMALASAAAASGIAAGAAVASAGAPLWGRFLFEGSVVLLICGLAGLYLAPDVRVRLLGMLKRGEPS